MNESLKNSDPKIYEILKKEIGRQRNSLMLIPSENYASRAVLETQASVFTNKYAEGYSNKRYYQGCQYVEEIEELAIRRAKQLFKAEHVNVQAHSGTQANIAVYHAFLKPGDTILSLSLPQGGHLSHGKKGTLPYSYYRIVHYGLSQESERFDYQEIARLAHQYHPRLIVVGTSAYPRAINFHPWKEIAQEVGAYLMVDAAHIIGLIAAGWHPDPVPLADVVTATTQKTLRGPRGGFIICSQKHASKIDKAVFPGTQGGPFVHIIAAKAVCFGEASQPEFKKYQHQIILNAQALAKCLNKEGFRLITGGTDNHLLLIDLSDKGLTGQEGALILEQAGIVVNKNCIPFEHQGPSITSGIRMGTPALTSRGMKESQMNIIGQWIAQLLTNPENKHLSAKILQKVHQLCQEFPIYQDSEC